LAHALIPAIDLGSTVVTAKNNIPLISGAVGQLSSGQCDFSVVIRETPEVSRLDSISPLLMSVKSYWLDYEVAVCGDMVIKMDRRSQRIDRPISIGNNLVINFGVMDVATELAKKSGAELMNAGSSFSY
jgi:hypothetical protein